MRAVRAIALHGAVIALVAGRAAAQDTTGSSRPVAPAALPVTAGTVGAAVAIPAGPLAVTTAPALPAPSALPAVAAARSAVAAPQAAPSPSATVSTSSVTAAAPSKVAPAPAAEIPANELANSFVQRAVSLYEMGKDEAAIAEYRKGLANDPLDSDTWFGLAELYRELGRTRQAVETYTLALATIDHAPELRLPFADMLMALHRKPEAIKVLQRGIELDPDASAEMKAMLGNVVLGVLDDAGKAPDDTSRATSAKTAPRARRKVARTKQKKLCKLFCAGAFDPIVPKPE